MGILLDQNVPVGIRRALETEHRVQTAYRRGWAELTNVELLSAAEQDGFDRCITADRNLRYQQNLADRRIANLVLPANDWRVSRGEIESVRLASAGASVGQHVELSLTSSGPAPRKRPGPAEH